MSITQRHRRTHPYRQVLGRASLRTWSSADPLVTSFSGTMLYRAAETETGPGPDETWNDGCGSDGGGTSEASPHLRRSTRPFGGVTGCPATCGYDLAIGRGTVAGAAYSLTSRRARSMLFECSRAGPAIGSSA